MYLLQAVHTNCQLACTNIKNKWRRLPTWSFKVADTVTKTWCSGSPASNLARQWSNMRNTAHVVLPAAAEASARGDRPARPRQQQVGAGYMGRKWACQHQQQRRLRGHTSLTCAAAAQQDEGLGREGVPLDDLLQAGGQAGRQAGGRVGGRARAFRLAPELSQYRLHSVLLKTGAKAGGCAAEGCAWQAFSLAGAQQQAGLTVSSGDSLNLKSTSVCPSFVITAAAPREGRSGQGRKAGRQAGRAGRAGQGGPT